MEERENLSVKISSYPVARDYRIDCVTHEDFHGKKTYDVDVVFETLGIAIESFRGMERADEANACFKKMRSKYEGI